MRRLLMTQILSDTLSPRAVWREHFHSAFFSPGVVVNTEAISERLAVFGAKVDEAEACSAPARRQAPAAGSRPGPPGGRASPARPAVCSSPRAERLPGERHDTDRTGRRLGVTTTVQNTRGGLLYVVLFQPWKLTVSLF